MHAKYNALLIAREDYNYAKKIINNSEKIDQNLNLFHKIDSTKLDSAKLYLTDAVKKASIIAERHSNSKYLDEAYLLLADARLEKQEYFNAIETYKYVNANAKTKDRKHQALLGLLLTYIYNEDFASAEQVSSILKNELLNAKNKSKYLLLLAHSSQLQENIPTAIVFLEEAMKGLRKDKQRARYYYCLAKMYENVAQPLNARKNFRNCLKAKPSYDLEFNAKMGLLGTESLAKSTAVSFKSMLEDRKNQDLLSGYTLKWAK
jgi:tetratricopeptide (TPR) repeat protein